MARFARPGDPYLGLIQPSAISGVNVQRILPAHLRRIVAVAVLVAGLGGSTFGAAPVGAAMVVPTDAPMILNNVSPDDLLANTRGVCNGNFDVVIRGISSATNALRYLDAAEHCGLKVVAYLAPTVSGGTVYPSRVAALVRAIKNHPALYGYLSVKEPSWIGINAAEIRSLYKAIKAADPAHPVVALFGDIPHFGDTRNPYTTGMADIVMVDWYPVETSSSGCSSSGTSYIANGPKWYSTKVYPKVHRITPKAKIWVMVQTHKYLAPSCHKKQRPTQSLLNRQVREAFTYAHANGIAFHTFENANYNLDERRDATMVGWMKLLANQVHAGTFR
jgi:hypothetical protein